MITIASKTLTPEKAFRQTGCFGQFARSIHLILLSG
jgi:hypothetical protein